MNLLSQLPGLEGIVQGIGDALYSGQIPPEKVPYMREGMINAMSVKTKIEMWHDYGDKTFILSPELVEAFQHTDVPLDIYPMEFPFPFESFTVESEVPLFRTRTGYIMVDGQRVGRDRPTEVHTLMYLSGRFVERRAKGTEFIRPDGTVASGLDWDHSLCSYFPGEGNLGLETITVNMRDNMTVQQACDQKKQGLLITELDEGDRRNMLNIFFNTMMYVNDPTRDVSETQEYGRRKVKLKGRKKAVKMDYIYLKPPRGYVSLSAASGGHSLDKRFVVRGHYRKQAHGPQRALRKRIWIQPYWKGPEWAERMSRPYKVD